MPVQACRNFIAASFALLLSSTAPFLKISSAHAEQAFCAEGAIIDCRGECGGSELFDECKVCAGSGKTTFNTAQAGAVKCCPAGSPAFVGTPDDCGKCGGSNGDKDVCGKCFGSGKQSFQTAQAGSVQCCPAGTPNYTGAPDDCGQCGGNNSGKDVCGKCGGGGKVNNCCPAGTPNFTGNPDACGVCGGSSSNCCPLWGVKVNRGEAQTADWFNPDTSLFPECAKERIGRALRNCGNDEGCANDRAFAGDMITSGENQGVVLFNSECRVAHRVIRKFERDTLRSRGGVAASLADILPDACVFATVRYDSPISLLVNGGDSLRGNTTLTKFPLNPLAPNNWVEWHASSEAPLLVHDPEHTGHITRADQLFGNWTFGGQAHASQSGASTATPWANGYDALGTLDENGDGKISGNELAPLGLWFDANQDAVSQPGEVKSISSAGVTALFYQGATVIPNGKNIYLQKGFEGSLAGAKGFGTSVDWFARSAESRHELLAELTASSGAIDPAELNKAPISNQPRSLKHTPLHAVYTWKEDIEDPSAGQGLLTFSEVTPGTLEGITVTEMPLNDEWAKKTGAARAAAFNKITGTIQRNEKDILITFTVEGQATKTESTLTLDVDGKTGKGVSKVSSRLESGERSTITYNWKAEKTLPE
jgi:hypothetical protein